MCLKKKIIIITRYLSDDGTRLQAIPSLFSLVHNKAEPTYDNTMKIICGLLGDKVFKEVMTDFELGLVNSVKKNFKYQSLLHCWFHMGQAIQRNVDKLGFKKNYQLGKEFDVNFRYIIVKTRSIALIPMQHVEFAIESVRNEFWFNKMENRRKYRLVFDYAYQNWLADTARFKPITWNCSKEKLKTNNATEGSNNRLNKQLGGNIGSSKWVTQITKLELQFQLEFDEMKRKNIKRKSKENIDNYLLKKDIIAKMNKLKINDTQFVKKFDTLWDQLILSIIQCSSSWKNMKQSDKNKFLPK